MTTVATRETPRRADVGGVLERLRSRIRKYVALEGGALVLAAVGGLFWVTLLVDVAFFRATNLELPVAVRTVFGVLAVASLVAAAVAFLVLRLAKQLRGKALALVLERRFPELNDRVILAVETLDRDRRETRSALEEAMLTRALEDADLAADRLDLADVFDRRPLRRAAIAAAVLIAPILLLAVVQPGALATWWNAYVRLAETYHPRETAMRLVILAPPDDQPRLLEPGGVYKHPRGANLAMLLEVPEGTRPDGEEWRVPETAYARRRTDSGARQTLPAVKSGERQFRLALEEIRDGMDLWITGGDFSNRSAYRIEVVDPPRVDRVELESLYPRYTGRNEQSADGGAFPEATVLSSPIAEVPAGTFVLFRATSNKPIRSARVRLGEQELFITEERGSKSGAATRRATLTVPSGEEGGESRRIALPAEVAQELVARDGRGIVVPLLVRDGGGGYLPNGPTDRSDLPKRPMFSVPLQTPVRITFEDVDLVSSLEASRFDVRGKPDEAPKIDAKVRGVSSIITRTAVVPVQGQVRDDYGVADVRFDFKIEDAEEWSTRPLANPPSGLPKEFPLRRDAGSAAEWLDTATLNLRVGQKLTVALTATDGDDLTGPHLTRGDQHMFTIVTPEELLSALYNQEINLRKRFEQSLTEIKEVRADLAEHGSQGTAPRADSESAAANALRSAVDRAFAETQQHAGEVKAVEQSFGEILEQLVNNRVHTEMQLSRIRTGVLEPLQRISNVRFPELDRAVGELRLRVADGEDPKSAFSGSIGAADRLIAEMEAALEEMQDLAEFHEAIQELTKIFEDERALLDRTKDEQKRSVIDALEGLLE